MNRRSILAAIAALPLALGLGLPAFAQDAKPLAGKAISVLLPPWGTLPKPMTDRFTADTGIALETQTLGWDDIRTKIVTSMVAGTAPANVTEVDWSWVGQFGSAGWYDLLDGKVPADLLADLPTAKIFQFDGKLLAVPYNNDFRILILNRDHLTRAGVKDAPKTPDELLAAAKAIKAAGVAEYPIGLPLSATEGSATAWYLLTKAFGGELFDADFAPLFTAPDSAGFKAMTFEVEALKAGLIDPAATGLKDVEIQELFKSGRISFDVAGWAGNVAVYSDKSKSQVADTVEAALLPSTTGTSRTFGLPGAVGIPVSAADPEAGLAFVEWLLKPENQIESYATLGNLPTRTSVLEKLNADGKLASGTVLLQQAALVEPLFAQGTPGWYPEFSSAVATFFNQAAKGQITVAEAVEQIAAAARRPSSEPERDLAAAPPRRARRFGGEAWLGLAFVVPIVAIMGGLVFLPVVSTLIDSLYRIDPMRAGTPFVGLGNYTALMGDANVRQAWFNTLIYVVVAVALQAVGGLGAALLLNRIRYGRRWLLAALVVPWCPPPVVNALVWLWIYNPSYGLLNAVLQSVGLIESNRVWFNDRTTALFLIALVHVWRMMPLTAIILLAALQSIPKELYEAAKLDGAGPVKAFRLVTLPLISGGIAIALSQSTVFAFNLFDEAWILAGTSLDTRTVIIQVYMSAFQNLKFSLGMALSVLAMIASLLVSLIYVLRVYRETRFE